MKKLAKPERTMLKLAGFVEEREVFFDYDEVKRKLGGNQGHWNLEDTRPDELYPDDPLRQEVMFLNFVQNKSVWVEVKGVERVRLVGPWEETLALV